MSRPSLIYVDNNATTCVTPEVREAMLPYFEGLYFNPSSMYEPAMKVAEALKTARREIAQQFFLEESSEILFTSCATESNNHAIFGAGQANFSRRHIITTQVEHPAVLEVCAEMERRGFQVTYLPVDRHGRLDKKLFIQALEPGKTLLVSIMHANNETGVVFPVGELARITKETDPEILFHTDATQSVTKRRISLSENGAPTEEWDDFRYVDMLSCSGHKFHAPKGVGLLFIRRGTPLRPYLIGGHQESGRRGGTENVPYIIGMAAAMKQAAATHSADEKRIRELRDYFENTLLENVQDVEINGQQAERMGNTTNISCHFIEGESILYELSAEGICASSGSACTSGSLDPSHVLRAMKVPFSAVHGSIRFSFSRFTTKEEVDRILEVFPRIIERLRKASPYSRENAVKELKK
ncbi:MAG: aminotransferase class V-fold PLP-dependent enzyme [Planctomycetia bacterium]|nr:aminotransferase class V-fold PLP-dependent enzyme [Planctomycetia bacterium]